MNASPQKLLGSGQPTDFLAQQVLANANGVFQTVQQGAHYLAAGSPYRNWAPAVTNLGSGLLDDLRKLTTYPPVVLSSDFTTDTILAPQAQRDVDTLDLGFHYAPLDYLCSARTVSSGCTLLLTNGVALAAYGTRLVSLQSSTAKLVSEGMPVNLNVLTMLGAAQEQPTTNSAPTYLVSASAPQVTLRFTRVTLPGGQKIVGDGSYNGTLSLQDCQVAGLTWSVYTYTGNTPYVVLKNNLFESCTLSIEQGYAGTPYYLHLTLRNNLLTRTPLTLWYSSSYYGTWQLYDNLFDGGTLTLTPSGGSGMPASHNGFIGTTGPGYWSNNKNSLSRDFVTGPLGDYYYPSSGSAPSLASLIDADSTRTVASMGLYHYTTITTTSSKEATSNLDIGFHFVGVNSSNQPLDQDGDSMWDVLEDRNGNGSADGGETDWTQYNSENGLSGTPALQVFTPLR